MKKFIITTTLLYAVFLVSVVSAGRPVFRFNENNSLASSSSLQAYYRLENVTDFWGATNLTNNNTVAFNAGKIFNAADGGSANTNKYLSIGYDFGIFGGIITISCWVNITDQINSGTYTFCVQGDGGNFVNNRIDYEFNGGTRRICWYRGRAGVGNDSICETVSLTTGTWYHLVYTYDNTNIEGWRNNASVGTAAASGTGSSSLSDCFNVLMYCDGTSNPTSGLIDETSIWNRKLTNAEIGELWFGSRGNRMVKSRFSSDATR